MKTVQGVYDFGDGNGLLATIQEHAGSAGILLVVGHNPSMEELANRLIGRGARKLRDQLNAKFPTAALAVLRFELAKWKDLRSASAELTHFIRPRDVLTGKPC